MDYVHAGHQKRELVGSSILRAVIRIVKNPMSFPEKREASHTNPEVRKKCDGSVRAGALTRTIGSVP